MYKLKNAVMITLACLLISKSIFAQAPQKMSYQAVIRDANGLLVTSKGIGMEINIRQGTASGTIVYTETQTPTTNANGLVSIEIGGGTGFSIIDWASDNYYIETKTAIDPPLTTYTITGVSQLLSVPYALNAKSAESITGTITETDPVFVAWDKDYNDLTNKPAIDGSETILTAGTNVTITGNGTTASPYVVYQNPGTAAGQMQYWNDSAWVNVEPGLNGQILKYKNGVPTWSDGNINELSIGDGYQGGVIAYFLVSGDPGYDANVRHGLIAAPSDQSTAIQWYNGTNTTTGATATALGTGNANTNTIVTNQGAGSYAAILCSDLVLGGYSDWYLPSKDELNKLYLNKDAIGGFASIYYWASSEISNNTAWVIVFSNGAFGNLYKYSTYHVRAVRSF
ncbi:MAG TPA: DUF1566 domain-containing protein [Bacteroidales bacterium]|nr:DUF1566 domain-containing protein [Bacteroidales bacterium]